MKRIFANLLAGLLLAASAQAQGVNQVPQVGSISNIYRNPTYTASAVGLVPPASATDVFCINSNSTKNIAIRRITVAGTAGTAITTPFLVYRRASQDTGGTASTSLAAPVAVPHNTTDPASTTTLIGYTANPTIVDSSPALLETMLVDLPVTTAAGGNTEVVRTYGTATDMFSKGLDIPKNTTQQICLNLNGVSVSSGVLQINMEWTETN